MIFKSGDEVGIIQAEGRHAVERATRDILNFPLYVSGFNFTEDGKYHKTDAHTSMWLWDTGKPPYVGDEVFVYPLIMESIITGNIIAFDGLDCGTYLKVVNPADGTVGEHAYGVYRHTNKEVWKPCERPVWKPEQAEIKKTIAFLNRMLENE